MAKTTISVDETVADRLYDRKGRGETYNDVIIDLLDRVEQIESDPVDKPTDDGAEAIEPADPVQSEAPQRADLVDTVRSHLEAEQFPKTAHGRAATVDVFAELREHGELSTGDLKAAVYPNYRDQWSSKRTMWETLSRYLEEIPGIEKGGYGKWRYAGDDAVRSTIDT